MDACNVERIILILIFGTYFITLVAAQRDGGVACNFDNGFCLWRNVYQNQNIDDFNWKRGVGSDGKFKGSGGVGDHNGGGGYVYIKSKNRRNRTALLQSPTVKTQGQSCFQFWYLMKGRTLGHLEVLMSTKSSSKVPIWNLRGHQSDKWLNGKVPVTISEPVTFWFEAFDWEEGRSGNILLDEVSMVKVGATTPCTLTPSFAEVVTSTQTVTILQQTTANTTTSQSPNVDAAQTTAKGITTTPSISAVTQSPVTRVIVANRTITQSAITPNYNTNHPTLNTTRTTLNTARENYNSTLRPVEVAKPSRLNKTWIAVSVLAVLACLVVALLLYLRRKKKQRTTYVDESSVVMMRMYPDITSEPRVEYSKLT